MQEIKPDLFEVNSAKGKEIIDGNDILFVKASEKNTDIYFGQEKKITILKSLKQCCSILKKYVTCDGCSVAINLNQVKSYHKKSCTITFRTGDTLVLTSDQAKKLPGVFGDNFPSL